MTYVVICINPQLKGAKRRSNRAAPNRGVAKDEPHVFGPFSMAADAFREAANADKDCEYPHVVSTVTERYT